MHGAVTGMEDALDAVLCVKRIQQAHQGVNRRAQTQYRAQFDNFM